MTSCLLNPQVPSSSCGFVHFLKAVQGWQGEAHFTHSESEGEITQVYSQITTNGKKSNF